MSAATTPAPRRFHLVPRTRRGRITTAVLLLVGIPALAYALYLVLMPITGNVQSRAMSLLYLNPTADTCTVSVPDALPTGHGTTLNVSADFYPGDECAITTGVFNDATVSSEPARVIGVTEPAGMPADWTLSLDPAFCGTQVATGADVPVGLVLALDAAATSPGSGALPSGLALEAVPESQYDAPTMCP